MLSLLQLVYLLPLELKFCGLFPHFIFLDSYDQMPPLKKIILFVDFQGDTGICKCVCLPLFRVILLNAFLMILGSAFLGYK